MKMQFGALVVDGRGKIGGHVASRNRSGAYLRTKVTPVNPQTLAQQMVRNRLTSLSQGWRSLTPAQRAAWDAAVSDYARTDIFGNLRNPTGKNLYLRVNANLLGVGEAAISTPVAPQGTSPVVAGTLTATDTPTMTVALSGGDGTCKVQIWATAPQSAGKSFVKSEYRLIGNDDDNVASPLDIQALYSAKFGAQAAGTKVFVKLVPVNTTSGEQGTGSASSAIVS